MQESKNIKLYFYVANAVKYRLCQDIVGFGDFKDFFIKH